MYDKPSHSVPANVTKHEDAMRLKCGLLITGTVTGVRDQN